MIKLTIESCRRMWDKKKMESIDGNNHKHYMVSYSFFNQIRDNSNKIYTCFPWVNIK
jgi:hypothetical protein